MLRNLWNQDYKAFENGFMTERHILFSLSVEFLGCLVSFIPCLPAGSDEMIVALARIHGKESPLFDTDVMFGGTGNMIGIS